MVQPKKGASSDSTNGTTRRDGNMSFQRRDIADARGLSANAGRSEGRATNGNRSFRTDTAIANSRQGNERTLKPWIPDTTADDEGETLEKSTSSGTWDQFRENERLFGLKTDYDENIYTTRINKNDPRYQQRLAAAEKKAREIERSAPTTAHVAEERIMDFVGGDDQDEEDKYSGVRRQDFPPLGQPSRENKYTPPARRAPSSQSTVKGAPVDPAIISSQLKVPSSTQSPSNAKPEEAKAPIPAPAKSATPPTSTSETKSTARAENKSERPATDLKSSESSKPPTPVTPLASGTKTAEKSAEKPAEKPAENLAEKPAAPPRPAAAAAAAGRVKDGAAAATPSASSTVEHDVLKEFKSFATQQRLNAEKVRSSKAKADKEVKLIELKKFADSFKLATPVPSDLISIIAKDPAKQKQIQAKAMQNAEEIARRRAEAAAASKEKAATPSSKESAPAKPAAESPSAAAAPASSDHPRSNGPRPGAPPHSNSSSGLPNRHPASRQSYNPPSHYQQGYRNNRPPHMAQQNPPTGNLAQRIRDQKMHQPPQHPHLNQHGPVDTMRLPPTGPANTAEPPYGRRLSGVPPAPHMAQAQAKLNPNSHEFRPSVYAPAFNPAGPSQGSSPRSVSNIVDSVQPIPAPAPAPVAGQLIRRKTKAIDVKKCFILTHIKTIRPPQGRNWDDNDGLMPPYVTIPTWRQLNEETEKPDSTMHLTYKEYFEKLPLSVAAMATPNPASVVPQIPHQHQLPFHLQHGAAHSPVVRHSPHMPPMQMHAPQHGPVPHVPPFAGPDDHRMTHSNSAQSFTSPPRMGQVPLPYPPAMNSPAHLSYSQPVMQPPYMNAGAPQAPHFRGGYPGNPQFVSQQPPHVAAGPIMMQPQFIAGPGGMVAAGPQMQMYPAGAHPQFVPPGPVPPQPMGGSSGYPSPSRPAAPMMVHQGSHQGQPIYAMSPGMQYQQPAFVPQQPQKYAGQRPQ
ncbi:hypothetical protein VTK73DRAFT_8276 [Phialemonium thermophilum]|uniref:LsmAD domain-containing protein n=1 Tax=Phialemonium thermophilum TaxID=223376 RepID=A0ABR3W9L2_9PEZI